MIRFTRFSQGRRCFVALFAVSVVALAGCGSEEAEPSAPAPESSSVEEESSSEGDERPTLEAHLAEIDEAALTGLTMDQCDDILSLISWRRPGWLDETASLDVDIDIVSRSPDDVGTRFERWLENAREDAAAREQIQIDDSSSFDEEQDLAFNNPLGLNGSERAERQHEDAWVRLWLIRSCEQQIEDMGTGPGTYVLDTEWPALPALAPEDASEGTPVDPAVIGWASDVLEVIGASGISAAYREFGSEACRAWVSDPLVAHYIDLAAREPTAVEDDEGSTWEPAIGAWLYGADEPATAQIVIRRIVTSPDSQDDVSSELTSGIPIVAADGGFQLDNRTCFSTA